MDILGWLFRTQGFYPEGVRTPHDPALIQINIVTNLLTGLSLLSIPIILLLFMFQRKRPNFFRYRFLAVLFSLFLFACGLTYIIRVTTYWTPIYNLQVVANVATAILCWIPAPVMVAIIVSQDRMDSESEGRLRKIALDAGINPIAIEDRLLLIMDRLQVIERGMRRLEDRKRRP